MHTKATDKVMDMICDEIEEIAEDMKQSGRLDMNKLEKFGELVDIKKNMLKTYKLEEDDGYSRDGGWEARGTYGRGMSYDDDGNSYARGRTRNRTRDGRYARNYSRGDAKEHMIDQLEDMMDDADSEKEREAIKRCISQLKNA